MENRKNFTTSIKQIEKQLFENYGDILSESDEITVPFFNPKKQKLIWLVYDKSTFLPTGINFKLLEGQNPPDAETIGGSVSVKWKIDFNFKKQKFSIGKSRKVRSLELSMKQEKRQELIKKYYSKLEKFIKQQDESLFIELKTIFFDLFGVYCMN